MTYEIDNDIRETLRDIFGYLDIDTVHANNATIKRYLERLIERNRNK